MPQQDCPAESEIVDLAEGRLAPEPRQQLLAHLDDCDECRRIVAALAPDASHGAQALPSEASSGARERGFEGQEKRGTLHAELLPGRVIGGRYRIERPLGAGGMGAVFAASHIDLDKRVALKVVRSDLALDDEAVSRLLREAKAAAALDGEHVVGVLDAGRLADTGDAFVVYEYLDGQDLSQLLAAKGRLDIGFVTDLVLGACEALVVAHSRGIIHRDIKPANLFLTERADGTPLLKVLDFGIAKVGWSDGTKTSRRAILGSPRYMAPEQLRSSASVDARADVWSLGVTLFELVCGEAPFVGDSVIELCAAIATEPPRPLLSLIPSTGLDAVGVRRLHAFTRVLESCLEKPLDRRCPDIAALALALEPFATEEGRASARRVARIAGRARSLPPGPADARSSGSGGGDTPAPSSAPNSGPAFSQPRPAADPATASTLSATSGATFEKSKTGPMKWIAIGAALLVTATAATVVMTRSAGTGPTKPVSASEGMTPTATSTTTTTAMTTATPTTTATAMTTATSTTTTTAMTTAMTTATPSAPTTTTAITTTNRATGHAIERPTAEPSAKASANPNPFHRDGLSDRH